VVAVVAAIAIKEIPLRTGAEAPHPAAAGAAPAGRPAATTD